MQSSAFFPQASAPRAPDSKPQASITAVCDYQSSSPRTPYGAGQSSSQHHGSRGFRFPSSRRFLWDRTPAGAQVLINVEDHTPHVQIAASAFSALKRAAEQQSPSAALQLGLSVTVTNQVTAVVQELDPLVAQATADCLQLTCPLLSASHHEGGSSCSRLQDILAAQLEQRSTATVQQLYAISAAAEAAGTPVERFTLQLELLMPCCSFLATPLYTKRLCNVPLAEALLKPGKLQTPQTGYLSMDQARSLLPLEATDVNVYSTPLVGIWVKGPSSVLHPLVAVACVRFVYSSLLADRAVNPDNAAFLLLLCPEGDPVSKCFEVYPTEPQQLTLSSYQLHASFNPSAGTTHFTNGGCLTAKWVLSKQQPQPMPGQLRPSASGNAAAVGAAGRAVGTPAGVRYGVLALPGPGDVAAGSPAVMGRAGLSNKLGPVTAARSSAPDMRPGASCEQQQQHAAAAARRSLPLPGAADVQLGFETATAGNGVESQVIDYSGQCREDSSSAEPERRASFHPRPYGSPPLQSWAANRHSPLAAHQQQQDGEQQQQQEWVQLGEQLLGEPSATGLQQQQQLRVRTCQQQPISPVGHQPTGCYADDGTATAALPVLGTHLGRQQQWPGSHAADGGLPAGGMQHSDVSLESSFQVHALRPVSPSVQAGVALSNLALLQHLSTGQLEQAIDRVSSPSKSRSNSPAPQSTAAPPAAACQQPGGSPHTARDGVGDAHGWSGAVSSSRSPAAAVDKAAWLAHAKPQTPDTTRMSTFGGSLLMGSPRTGPTMHYAPPDSCTGACRAATSSSPLRSSTDSASSAAAAALQAATAAVRALSPNPYPKGLGVQRYAADAAVLTSQEYGQAGFASTARPTSATTAAAAGGGRIGISTSMALLPAAHRYTTPSSSSMAYGNTGFGQRCSTDGLDAALQASAAAVDSSAAALDAADQMMNPYNAPDAAVCYQQTVLQHDLLPTVWNDPVAQALQQEVHRLRHELQQLRHQLRSAGMPRLEALALPPLEEVVPGEPVAAVDALPAASPVPAVAMQDQQSMQNTAQQLPHGQQAQQQQLQTIGQQSSAVEPAVSSDSGRPVSAGQTQQQLDSRNAPQEGWAASVPVVETCGQSVGVSASQQATNEPHRTSAKAHSSNVNAEREASVPQRQQQQVLAVGQQQPLHPAMVVPTPQQNQQPQVCQQQQQGQQQSQGQSQSADDALQQLPLPVPAVSPERQQQRRHHRTHQESNSDDEQDDDSGRRGWHHSVDAATKASSSDARNGVTSATGAPRKASVPAAAYLSSPTGAGSPAALKKSGAVRAPYSSSVRESHVLGGVRSSLEVPPLVEVVRTKYCALDDDSEDSDREFEERLMLKYGMKH